MLKNRIVQLSDTLVGGYDPVMDDGDGDEIDHISNEIVFDDAVAFLVSAKSTKTSPAISKLAIGRAQLFGKMRESAKFTSMWIDSMDT